MADIALVFHWSPAAMDAMQVSELMQWHSLAVERHNANFKNLAALLGVKTK